jgi:hypothetical protein
MEPEVSLPCSQQPATGPYLSQMNPVHNFPLYFPNNHSNIFLPSTPKSKVDPVFFKRSTTPWRRNGGVEV